MRRASSGFTFGHWLMPFCRSVVIVHGEKLVRHATSQKCWGLYKKGNSYRLASDLIGHQALLASPDSELWRRQRQITQKAFSLKVLSTAVVPAVHEAMQSLMDGWEANYKGSDGAISVDFCNEAPRLTIDVLGKVAFGFDFGQSRGADAQKGDIADAFHTVLTRMAKVARNPLRGCSKFLPMKWTHEYERALAVLNKATQQMIDRRLVADDLGDDLIGHLLKASNSDEAPLGRDLVAHNLKTFLFAGHDTTASALCWCVHLLGAHPEVQDQLAQELVPLGTGIPTVEQLESLPFLDAVIRETLRLYPSAGFTKAPEQDLDLCGHSLPKGIEVFFFPYLTHRDEHLFTNANSFEPQRWFQEPLKGSSPERAGWIPFSLGARNCVGSRMALLELKAAVHVLLAHYKLTLPGDQASTPSIVLFFTLEPNFVPMELRLRTH